MENIQALIDFCEGIPENQWIGNDFEREVDGITKRCVAGHINHYFTGKADHTINDEEPAQVLCNKLGISRYHFVTINNNAYLDGRNVKSAVISFLKERKEEVAA